MAQLNYFGEVKQYAFCIHIGKKSYNVNLADEWLDIASIDTIPYWDFRDKYPEVYAKLEQIVENESSNIKKLVY